MFILQSYQCLLMFHQLRGKYSNISVLPELLENQYLLSDRVDQADRVFQGYLSVPSRRHFLGARGAPLAQKDLQMPRRRGEARPLFKRKNNPIRHHARVISFTTGFKSLFVLYSTGIHGVG